MKGFFLIFLLILTVGSTLASPAPASADSPDLYPFSHLIIENQPYKGQVAAIAQDDIGFIWFGGTNGLNRFDGYGVEVFGHDPSDSQTISSNIIFDIYKDSTGVLWIGTQEGLNRYDAATETFQRFLHDPEDSSSLSNNQIEVIIEDSSDALWIGTRGGLNRFDRETGKFIRFLHDPTDPDSLSHNVISALETSKNGMLYIGTYGGGLDILDPATGKISHYRSHPDDLNSLTSDLVLSLHEDRQGALWVGTWDGGISRFDPENSVFTRFQHDPSDPTSLANNRVMSILEDRQGELWVGTWSGGLDRLDRGTDSFIHFQNGTDPDSLSTNTVLDIYEDRQGLMWIGTSRGADFHNPQRKPFQSYTHQPSNPDSLSEGNILAVLKDRSGVIWVGTSTGLDRIEGEHVTHYQHDPQDPTSLVDDYVFALAEDPDGALWVGTWGGLERMDRETGVFTHYVHDEDDPSSLNNNTIYSLYVDMNHVLWVGTYGGLNRFEARTGTFKRFRHDQQDTQSLSANPVFAITQDTSGILWVGTEGGGLNRMDPNTGEFLRYQHDAQEPTSIAANSVWCIYPDPSGGLWVGTSAGLNYFDPNSHGFQRYSSQDGLPSQSINGILPDSLGNLWLSTDQGLFWYSPLSGDVRTFNETDGLLDDDFELKAYFRDSEGQLFFGTNQGIIAFDPNQIQDNPYVPPVMITSLELENNPVQIDSSSVLEQTILQTESLEIPYSNRIISFSFSSLNYDAPKNNRYRYILEGFDDHWYEVSSSRRRVTYTNLDPGEYVFRVIGSNNDGVWNEIGTSITIRVIPPWWMTIWFRITVIVLSAGILLLTYNIQTSRIRQQNRLLETMVSSRTTQLEDINLSLKSEIAARQQVEEELRTSEARYRTIFETSGTAMAIAAEDFSLLLVNQEYERLSGYSREELESGMKWTDFVYPEDEDRVKGYNQLGWKDPMKPPRSYEFRFVNRNRQVRHVLSTASRIPGTKRVVASLQDITLYKELETMLQLQNERYKRATQAAGAGVYEWDLLTGNFYLDPSIKSFLGYEDWEIPNDIEIWATYIHPDDRQSTMESANAAIRGETPEYRCEYRMLARDGSIRWVLTTGQVLRDSNGQPLRMVGTDRDVTLRKQAEIQLKASEERFRSVWEAANDAMVLIDLGGNILAVNPAFYDLFGLDGEHVIEKHFTELVLQQDLEMVEKDFQTALSNEPMLRFERQISRRDGTSVVVDVSISSIILEAEQRMILAVVRDITSRKEVETSLKKVSNQLTTLLVVSQNIVSLMDIDPLLDLVLEQLTQVIPYDAASILSIDQGRIEPLVYRGSAVPEEISYLRSHISENPILQQTARSKEVCYIEDSYAQDKLQERFGGSLAEWGEGFALYRSWLAIPLIVKENQIGILVLAHKQPNRFDPAERSLAKIFGNQAAIAMDNVRLYRQAKETAVTSERMRLGRDLHDSVTQALYAINLYSEASRLALSAGKINVTFENLNELQSTVHEAVTDLRVMIYELRPPLLEEKGLTEALKNRLDAVEARLGIDTELQVEGERKLPPKVETELFRVAQEALTNVVKHAKAHKVEIYLRFEEDQVHLEIRDDGLGFNNQDLEASKGMGLKTLSERIQHLGGNMTIETSPGEGTALYIDFRTGQSNSPVN